MIKAAASILSVVYASLVRLKEASYRLIPGRIKKVDARVISVGNITWGGTGKTPLVIALAKTLSDSGKKVAVLTRGYGKDEVAELKNKLLNIPVLAGKDRVRSGREAVKKYNAQVLIIDDGFQYIRMHRDVDVVNINATLPFGSGSLIPRGILREPLEALARADIFVLTKSNIGSKNVHLIRQKLLSIKPNAVIFEAVHKPVDLIDIRKRKSLALNDVKNKKFATISGIGDPHSFEKTVEYLHAEIVLAARFRDHYQYTENDLLTFVRRCKECGVKDIVTTEKDFYRMEPVLKNSKAAELNAFNFFVLQIEFELSDEEDFIRRCFNP